MLNLNEIYNIDCLTGMAQIADKSIDMIFVDLPYGVTAKNKWDSVIITAKDGTTYRISETKVIMIESN